MEVKPFKRAFSRTKQSSVVPKIPCTRRRMDALGSQSPLHPAPCLCHHCTTAPLPHPTHVTEPPSVNATISSVSQSSNALPSRPAVASAVVAGRPTTLVAEAKLACGRNTVLAGAQPSSLALTRPQ
ncbi:hypothetical protein MRX96_042763 [Rhipicephalus microplus]